MLETTAQKATDITVRQRIATYGLVGIGLTISYVLLRGVSWRGSADLHSHMEALATFLALAVGVMALVRFHAKKNNTFLLIGAGFLGTAFLDGYHALVTSHFFTSVLASDLPSLISWSWIASRLFLSVLMALSWYAWTREQRLGEAGQVSEKTVYIGTGLLTLASFLFFAFVPLPSGYYAGIGVHRPEEFVPALFFLIALVGYLKKGAWRHDAFEHWLVLSLIVGFVGQAVFMSSSGQIFDFEFDAAHGLKKLSYTCVLTGLVMNMYATFKIADWNAENLKGEIMIREQIELNLAESEQRFRHYVEAASDWVWEMGPDQRFTYMSERITTVSGLPTSHYLGKTREEVAEIDDTTDWEGHFDEMESRRTFRDFEFKMTTADGRDLWVSINGRPHFDNQENFAGYRGTGSDITEYKKAEQALRASEARARAVIDTVVDAVIIIDTLGRVQLFNPSSEKIFGYRAEEVVGQNVRMLMPQPDRDNHDGYLKHSSRTVERLVIGTARELTGQRKNGSTFPMELSVGETKEKGERIFVGMIRDVTSRKITEEALGRRAAELTRSNAELEQFAYVASHDLQEPLRKVMAFGDRLQSKYGDVLDEQGRDYVTRMQNAAGRMQNLIHSLLSFSHVASKRRPLTSVNLNDMAEEVISDLEVQIQESGGEVRVADLPTVEVDPTQIRQLLQNLIGNALKYRHKDVLPVIEITAEIVHVEGGQQCQIQVRDNGIGFDPQFTDKIFGIFQRLHNRVEYEGTGVGLAICRKIAERHGGAISAEGRPGEGATFTVTLPMRQARRAA